MIKIKFEVNDEEEEEVTPVPIENENDKLLSMNFFNNNNLTSSLTNLNNVTSIDNNLPKKPKQLGNSTTNSVAVGSKSIKTEPAESSLSLTTQLNNSLNIQSLLIQQRIQNGWTTNEQSIPIGTQQQQQSLFVQKIEPIVPGNHQEVPISLDQSSSSLSNGTQQQQKSLFVSKTANCDLTEVPFVNQSSSISNLNSMETTATNCDITTTEMFPGLRASLGRRAKLNVCYSVPKESEPLSRKRKKLPESSLSVENSESDTSNDNDQHSGSGSISGFDPSFASTSSTTEAVAAPSPPPKAVPLLVGKKPLLPVPPLTLEERNARKRERERLRYHRQKANPEVKAKLLRKKEYHRKRKQQLLATATPEQRELIRLKDLERVRRQLENETEEQRQRRLERGRQYNRTGRKQRKNQLLATATSEQRELMRLKNLEKVRRHLENETEEQRQRRLERGRQYARTVGKQRMGQQRSNWTPEEREKKQVNHRRDSDSTIFDIDGSGGGNGEESNGQTITTLDSPKPGPSLMKLPRPTRCQRNLKSKIYLEPSTDSDMDDSD